MLVTQTRLKNMIKNQPELVRKSGSKFIFLTSHRHQRNATFDPEAKAFFLLILANKHKDLRLSVFTSSVCVRVSVFGCVRVSVSVCV